MAVDSNRPYQRVHNGGDGIWDGAGWGALAGAGAVGVAYGTSVHGAKHLASLNERMMLRGNDRIAAKNRKRADAHKPHLTEADLTQKLEMRNMNSQRFGYHMGNIQGAGDFMFGGWKRAAVTAGAGLLGGMLVGGAIDQAK